MTFVPKRVAAAIISASVLASICKTAAAHDIVIFPDWTEGLLSVDVKYGHPQDYQAVAAEKLYRFDVTTPAHATEDWRSGLKLDAMDLRLSRKPDWNTADGVTVLAAQYDNGYWSKNAAGDVVNTSRIANPKTTMASHNLKYGKALVATGPNHNGYDKPVGQKLELIPLADPFTMKIGDKLPVAVRLNGKPYAGAGVEIGDSVTAIPEDRIPRFKTDAKGVAMVPISKNGWQVVGVDYEERSPLQQLADKEKYTATLVFRLP